MQTQVLGYGNEYVIKLLERSLEKAKKQSFQSGIVSLISRPDKAYLDAAGESSLEKAQLQALEFMVGQLKKSIAKWDVPAPDPTLDASYFYYNLAAGPVGYDFVVWLAASEMIRERNGAKGPLKIAFWLGDDSSQTEETKVYRDMFLNNVFRPALNFVGAVEDNVAVRSRDHQTYTPGRIVTLFKNGYDVPRFKPVGTYDVPKGCITITVREAEHQGHRNSSLDNWIKFAKEINEPVVFVRDTRFADAPVDGGFQTCPLASKDVDARLYLYENSKLNLIGANGPCALMHFGTAPFLQFIKIEESELSLNCSKFWSENCGIDVGEQYPWFLPGQKIVWEEDTHENIIKAYREHV